MPPVVLSAGGASLVLAPEDGGRWTGLHIDGLSLLTGTTIPGAWPVSLHGCFPMAPYAGRTGGGVLRWRDEEHPLPLTAPPHAIHGLVADVGWRVTAQQADRVVLEACLDARWPWRGTVRQELALRPDGLDARLALDADEEQPVVLGLHPWFPRKLARGGDVQLVLPGGRQYVRGDDGLPTGELVAPLPPPWDDCFTGLDAPPSLRWPGALELVLTSSADHWVVFDERPDVVCVEPQTGPPDAVRLGRAATVGAGETLALDVGLSWRAA